MTKPTSGWVAVAGAVVAGLAVFASGSLAKEETDFVRITPAEVHWQAIPDAHGVMQAVLLGDPHKPGMYVVRVKFPPYVMDSPHWHPNARYVTVIEGTWYAGTGQTFDPAKAVRLKAGSFMLHPAKAVHWDGSGGPEQVIVEIVGEGPGNAIQADPKQPMWIDVAH